MLWVYLVVAILSLLFLWNRKPKNFPPGPPRLPVVGSLPFIAKYSTQFWRIQSLSDVYGKILGFYVGNTPTIILSDFETINKVFKMEEVSDRPPIPVVARVRYGDKDGSNCKGVIFSTGETWKEQRRFTLRTLRDLGFGKTSMESTISNEALKLTRLLSKEEGKPTSLGTKLNVSIVNALWLILVGEQLELEDPKLGRIIAALNKIIQGAPISPVVQMFPSLLRIFPITRDIDNFIVELRKMILPYKEEHKKSLDEQNPRDYLDMYINAQKTSQPQSSFHGLVGEQNMETSLVDLFAAGTETTSTTINWAILYLLHHPEVQDRIHEELDRVVGRDRFPTLEDEPQLPYTSAALLEVQRCCSLVYAGVPRYTTAPVHLGGFTLPRGSTVFANIIAVMHNPEVFPNPHNFQPDRFLNSEGQFVSHSHVIPFLVGKRYCIGMSLALKELFLFFTILLHHFKFQPVPGQKLPSYHAFDRSLPSTDSFIRSVPPYQLILKDRK